MIDLTKKSNLVNLDVHPDFAKAAPILKTAWLMAGGECIVTSGKDGIHSKLSAHYSGNALDLRRFNVQMEIQMFAGRLSKALNSQLAGDWYVVLEEDHIHLERTDDGVKPNVKGWTAGQYVYIKGSA